MPLQILSSPDAGSVAKEMREAIEQALPGARVEVNPTNPGHFAIRVVSEAFEGKPLVRQQQLVYGAIGHLMRGDAAPVHAIDQMETRTH